MSRILPLCLPLLLTLSCKQATDDAPDDDTVDVGLDERPSNPGCIAPGGPPTLTEAFVGLPQLDKPIGLVQAPGDPDLWYVAQQGGEILRFSAASPSTVDQAGSISDRLSGGYEQGLLGLAFHPEFQSNGEAFLSYTRPNGDSRIIRVLSTDGGATFDIPSSMDDEDLILQVEQPYSNHNGGHITFGPDGFLYIGLGDGGSGGDPDENGQDPTTLLGSILRIDVDGGTPYAIPSDNPYATAGGEPEIFAIGLRNPWRFSFDRQTGQMWAGDVGQNEWEEVGRIDLGGNYGWRTKEGLSCFDSSADCSDPELIDPVAVYGHDDGYSVTGGFVYRGSALPDLLGHYIYGDFGTGRIWSVHADAPTGSEGQLILASDLAISTFAEDLSGELYVVDHAGSIYRFDPSEADPDAIPTLLSETGCVDAADPTVMAEGLIPYEVNAPLWSDGLEKHRWMALPDGTSATVGEEGDLSFPAGTVLVKDFRHQGERVETRLFFHHGGNSWSGYSYVWNEDGTDAVRTDDGVEVDLDGLTWSIPGTADCLRCHTAAAGRSLGLELAQLDRDATYGDTTADQLATLSHIDILPEEVPEFVPFDEPARAYLHSNCSVCHRPNGGGAGSMDLRHTRSLAETYTCDVAPMLGDLEIADVALVSPGDPETSMISVRMHRTDFARMPQLGTTVVDESGTSLVDDWIRGITACPE